MARKANKISIITGVSKLDRATSSWRELNRVLPKLKVDEVSKLLEVEKSRDAPRSSFINKLASRYGVLQGRSARITKGIRASKGVRK